MTRVGGRALVAVLVSGAVLSSPVVAEAAFSASGTGNGQAQARMLPAPQTVTATCASATSIAVTWTIAQGAPVVVTFTVQRSADAGGSWSDVGTVNAAAATSYRWTDDGPPGGTYLYRVVANNNLWRRVSSPTSVSRTIDPGIMLGVGASCT